MVCRKVVEQKTHNFQVAGSSPAGSTNFILMQTFHLFFLVIAIVFAILVFYGILCSLSFKTKDDEDGPPNKSFF
jgi:RsiW-degrading membrane proteinase PrsW (M82 family)